MLSEKYQQEQAELEAKLLTLRTEAENAKQSAADTEQWIKLIQQYQDIQELDAPLLNTLIEKIVVHEGTKGPDGMRNQEIDIYYRFVGNIDS